MPGASPGGAPALAGLALCAAILILGWGHTLFQGDVACPPWASVGALAASKCSAPRRRHVFVHITDPQLGMKSMYGPDPADSAAEEEMFAALARKAAELSPKPRFAFLGGDMQNWWPNEQGIGRNHNNMVPDEELLSLDLGRLQREKALAMKKFLEDAGIEVACTAGNHDIGDVADSETLKTFEAWWGPHYHVVAEVDGVLYLQLNSQFYWDASTPELRRRREEQTAWLEGELRKRVSGGTKLLVVLCHIPPFMSRPDEPAGWSNWKLEDRLRVLGLLAGALKGAGAGAGMLWLCGHFHASTSASTSFRGVPLAVRVTGAAGTTMQWGGQASLRPEEAMRVAAKDIGQAFREDIGMANVLERMQAAPSRSGFRLFEVFEDGSFRDRWLTLDELTDTSVTALLQRPEPPER